MMRTFLGTVLALLLAAGGLLAEEIKGKVKSVDAEKMTITVTVGDKDTTFTVGDKVKNLKGYKEGDSVTLTTKKDGDKETVTAIKKAKKEEKK